MQNGIYRFRHFFSNIKREAVVIVVFLIVSSSLQAENYKSAETLYQSGQHEQAFQKLHILAKNGNLDAQFNLGRMYLQGNGTQQNYPAARRCFLQAAEKGDAGAQFNLGNMYKNGLGTERDCRKACFWYLKAAEKQYAPAQYALGILFSNGCGVKFNPYKATDWFMKAAQNGMPEAQYQMGYRYYKGIGIACDKKLAYEWMVEAARQDHSSAIQFLENHFDKRNTTIQSSRPGSKKNREIH